MQAHPPKFWEVRKYEWWDEGAWSGKKPAACTQRGVAAQGWAWKRGTPRTEVTCHTGYCVFENLWCVCARLWMGVSRGPRGVGIGRGNWAPLPCVLCQPICGLLRVPGMTAGHAWRSPRPMSAH